MTQLLYCNTRTALKGDMTKLKKRLNEAYTNLEKLKDVRISMHEYGALVVILATYQDMLYRKMTICNDKLKQLHSTIEHLASKEQNWTMET